MTRGLLLVLLLLQHPETLSLLGDPLYPPPLDKKERKEADAVYAEKHAAYLKAPNDRTAILDYARASLALGRIGDALEILTHGLEAIPEDPALLLERGRGYIVFRKFEVAQRDLRAAASLPDAHCALAFAIYVSGAFARARDAYGSCPQPDMFAALAVRRADRKPAAAPPAAPPAAPAVRFPGAVAIRHKDPPQSLADGYEKAMDELIGGGEAAARERLKKIVEKHRRQDWMDPVYIAAEADYARLYKPASRRR